MKLARIFTDYMVLQRNISTIIWGTAEADEKITVRLNGETVCEAEVSKGKAVLTIPAQPAMEDATLEIGDVTLSHVDFGEVWIAGGQSNMEFALQFTGEWEEERQKPGDAHLRMYTVGQYSYPGQREEGYKSWNPWDVWRPYEAEKCPDFSAVAAFFARELRKDGVPVGMISCNWAGTSASAWLDKELLAKDLELKTYLDDFDTLVSNLDMGAYTQAKKMMRPMMASPQGMEQMSKMMRNTVLPEEFQKQMGGVPPLPPFVDPTKVAPDKFMMWGPGDQNEPGALYENMVSEIAGISARGVIWYQGESDCFKDWMYGKLFTALIQCWRDTWKAVNPAMETLPFLFVQLAPYGVWGMNPQEDYTIVREQQELVSKSVPDTYMTTIGDLGNVYDIHPKMKKPVGERLALLAEKYIYGREDLLADSPEVDSVTRGEDCIVIALRNGDGLYRTEEAFTAYNGFLLSQIRPELIPEVTDGVNGLEVLADGEKVPDVTVGIEGSSLILRSPAFAGGSEVQVKYAKTAFYQINLFNRAGLPVRPFSVTVA